MTEKIVILSTCASEAEAARVAQTLVESGVAACVNVIPRVRSYYRWQGKLESGDEFMLVIKSSRDRFAAVRAAVERVHSYEVPELIALPIVEGAPAYLAWMEENLDR
jgi:periplasmic divalent cation tolerance protein